METTILFRALVATTPTFSSDQSESTLHEPALGKNPGEGPYGPGQSRGGPS